MVFVNEEDWETDNGIRVVRRVGVNNHGALRIKNSAVPIAIVQRVGRLLRPVEDRTALR